MVHCRIAVFIAVFVFTLAVNANAFADGSAAGGDYTSAAAEDPGRWAEDMDRKLDAAMKVLAVIKEEVREYQEEEEEALKKQAARSAAQDADSAVESDWITNLRLTMERIRRLISKLKKAAPPAEYLPTGPASPDNGSGFRDNQGKTDTVKDLKKGVDQAMEAMSVVKEELEKMENDNGESKR